MHQNTKRLFIAILNNKLQDVQSLIARPRIDLTFVLPTAQDELTAVLTALNILGDDTLKQHLSSNNPLLVALSLEHWEIAEVLLDRLLTIIDQENFVNKNKAIKSILHVNQLNLSALHFILINEHKNYLPYKLEIIHNILHKLMSPKLNFIDILHKCQPIFFNSTYTVAYNHIYTKIVYAVLNHRNYYNINFFFKSEYIKVKKLLITNKNNDLILFFALNFKDFFDGELMLIAIKEYNLNELQKIISINPKLAAYLINKDFLNIFNMLINSIDNTLDHSLDQNLDLIIKNITAKMELVFNLVVVGTIDMVNTAKILNQAISYYVLYRVPSLEEVYLIPWVQLYTQQLAKMMLVEQEQAVIQQYLANINAVLETENATEFPAIPSPRHSPKASVASECRSPRLLIPGITLSQSTRLPRLSSPPPMLILSPRRLSSTPSTPKLTMYD